MSFFVVLCILPVTVKLFLFETQSRSISIFLKFKVSATVMELFSKAHSFGCDKQGRINLSEDLLSHAGIKGKAVLAGNFTDFSIWSEDRYKKRKKSNEPVNIFDAMRELGL